MKAEQITLNHKSSMSLFSLQCKITNRDTRDQKNAQTSPQNESFKRKLKNNPGNEDQIESNMKKNIVENTIMEMEQRKEKSKKK